ncbi:MAG: type IV toxin-antitoxin system AbiEi family antitoxin [Candidatus Auribacterota bacterium]|nr:type IV toxin-antitoxin system AbiEi family antitoxin [Candidatus Auribacterota bacterium]
MKINEIEEKSKQMLENVFGEIPFIENVEITRQEGEEEGLSDFFVSFNKSERRLKLLVEVKSSGQPRFAREVVNQFLRLKEDSRYSGAYPVFMAPYISETSANICKESDVGYLDLAGNAYLSLGSIFISREGRKNPYMSTRALRSIYQPKSSRVVRVLLTNPARYWKFQDLSDEAVVSLGQVANVKKGLKDREWIKEGSRGFRLSDPESLLMDWAKNYSFERNQTFKFYTLEGPDDAENKIAEVCGKINVGYALTAFSAAARIAPAVRYKRVTAYLSGRVNDVAGDANFKRVESGANVVLALPLDEGIFYGATEVNGMKIASPIQVFLDLYGLKARGREAADMVFKQVIKPAW